jgi:hypothetical protein
MTNHVIGLTNHLISRPTNHLIGCTVFGGFSQGIGRASQVIGLRTRKAVGFCSFSGLVDQSGDSLSMGWTNLVIG